MYGQPVSHRHTLERIARCLPGVHDLEQLHPAKVAAALRIMRDQPTNIWLAQLSKVLAHPGDSSGWLAPADSDRDGWPACDE